MIASTRYFLMLRRVTVDVSAFHTSASAASVSVSSSLLTGSTMTFSPLSTSRRLARPTFGEITEDLHVMNATLDMSAAELKKTYRDLVRKHHPDAGGDEKTMSKITVAYERLSSLTNREKEEFKVQKNAYRGGSGSFGRGGANGYAQAQRTYAGQQRPAYGDAPHSTGARHAWGQDGSDFSREYARNNARATYNYNRGSQSYSENPFRNHDTVNLNQAFKHFVRMPVNSLIVRGLLVYMVVSMGFALIYRRYRDYRHEEGWKASESLSRHEQLERLHQLRQELQSKVVASRDEGNRFRRQDFEASRELRVQEYAQRRQLDAKAQEAELSSWPRFDDANGSLVKRPYDPPGITYFEPGPANERRRQISMAYGESRRERVQRETDAVDAVQAAAATATSPPPSQQQGPIVLRAGPDGTFSLMPSSTGGPNGQMPYMPPEKPGGVRAYVSSRDITPQEQSSMQDIVNTILRGPAPAPQRM